MRRHHRSGLAGERGATVVEYAAVLVLVSAVAIGVLGTLGASGTSVLRHQAECVTGPLAEGCP